MSPLSSSTSSSEVHGSSPPRRVRDAAAVIVWTVIFLAAGDVLIGACFPMPEDPTQRPGPLARFLDYGRSVEGKLRWMLGSEAAAAPVASAGWLDQSVRREGSGELRVAAYGMSFIFRICRRMHKLEGDDSMTLMLRGAPAAPLSHSYALYQRDGERRRAEADVVILGVLASSLPAIRTMAHATWNAEAPAVYTYPRFHLDEAGALRRVDPAIASLDELTAALDDPLWWKSWLDQLREHDEFYSDLIYPHDVMDHSVIGRLIRRALWQQHQRRVHARHHDGTGFLPGSGVTRLAAAILQTFARDVRSAGGLPIVVLIHDRGYADHLHAALGSALLEADIPMLSTHELIDTTRRENFEDDGHFSAAADTALAEALSAIIKRHRP